MKSSERLVETLKGNRTDRKPLVLTLSLYGARLTQCPLDEYYTNPEKYIRGQIAVYNSFQPDILFTPFVLPFLGAAFGSELTFFNNQPPNIVRPAIPTAELFTALDVPDTDINPWLLSIRKSLQLLVEQYTTDVPIAAIALSPIDLPAVVLGVGTWLETLLFNRKEAEKILKITTKFFVSWTNTLLADGATCIVLPIPFANLTIITPKIAEEIVRPLFKKVFADIAGPLILHHVGAPINGSLHYLKDLPNVIGYCVGKEDSLAEARSIIGPTSLLLGNIDGPGLLRRTPESIYNQMSAILRDRNEDPFFIPATSAADIDLKTPPENISAITEAVKDFAKSECL